MEHGEAWLLETLAMFRLPVRCMMRSERPMNEWLNRGYHELSPSDLISTLTRLFERGEIDAYYGDEFENPASIEKIIDGLGDSECKLHCGATHAGGNRWETLANPDWDRCFEAVGWDGEYVEITVATQERLDELVANADILWRCQMSVSEDSLEEIAPWEPFTWKTLPRGLKAKVRYTKIPFVFRSREEVFRDHKKTWPREVELRTWAKSICGNAYV